MFSLLKNIGVDVFANLTPPPEELDVALIDEHDPVTNYFYLQANLLSRPAKTHLNT